MKVTREDIKQTIHISYTQLRTFLNCPRKYYFQYVRGLEWEAVPAAIILGSAIHRTVEEFYRVLRESGDRISGTEMVKVFQEHLHVETEGRNISFKPSETLATMTQLGKQLIDAFRVTVNPGQIVADGEIHFHPEGFVEIVMTAWTRCLRRSRPGREEEAQGRAGNRERESR